MLQVSSTSNLIGAVHLWLPSAVSSSIMYISKLIFCTSKLLASNIGEYRPTTLLKFSLNFWRLENLKWHFSFHSVRRKMPSVNLNHGRQLNSDMNMQTWVRQKLIHLSSSWLQNSDLEILIEIGRYSRVCAVLVGLTTPVQYCNKLLSTWLDFRCRTKPCKIKLKRWFRVPISMKF